MNLNEKRCSRCQKFKSIAEYYKQGDRLESVCKVCKQKARALRKQQSPEVSIADNETVTKNQSDKFLPLPQNPKSYEDFDLTREDFLELVEFFQELMRLDRKAG